VLTQAAEAIRVFCLRWWRRRVTRSFFCWLHQKPEYQGVGLDDMSHVVEKIQVNTPGERERIYRWARLGRAVYCDWWSERDARHYKDLNAAREVAERSSRATWFEWTDGSASLAKGLTKGVGFGNCHSCWLSCLGKAIARAFANVHLFPIVQTPPVEPARHKLLGKLLSGAALHVAHFARQDGDFFAPTSQVHEVLSIHAGRSGAADAIE
jgi:hypothetical protein